MRALEHPKKLADKMILTLPEKHKMITQISNAEISKSDHNYKARSGVSEANDESKMAVNVGNMVTAQQLHAKFNIY